MKIFLIILILILLSAILISYILGFMSRQGMAPGLVDGKLSACKPSPNCVCSEFMEDQEHYIDPIQLHADNPDPISVLKDIVTGMGGRVESEKDQYFYATFKSRIFRFVDDLEIRIDPSQGVAHIRSSSRVGRSDFNANQKRVERIRKKYHEIGAGSPRN